MHEGCKAKHKGNADNSEVGNSKQLLDRLNKQYNPENGRLQEAVGEENSHSLVNLASTVMVGVGATGKIGYGLAK